MNSAGCFLCLGAMSSFIAKQDRALYIWFQEEIEHGIKSSTEILKGLSIHKWWRSGRWSVVDFQDTFGLSGKYVVGRFGWMLVSGD